MIRRIKSFLFENKTAKQTVAKNSFWLAVTNFGGRALKAVIIIYAARVLGTAGYGVFSYALTLAGFLTLFIDPGVNAMVMRETPKAQNEQEERRILATTLVMKLVLVAVIVLLVIFVGPYFSTLPGADALLPIVALIIAFDSTRDFLSAFLRGREKMEWETAIFLFTNLMIVVFGFAFLAVSPSPLSLGWAYTLGTVAGALAAAAVLRKYLKNIFASFSKALVKPILTSAWPFAVTGALGLLLTNMDILILSWMRDASEVGIYSAAIRIVQILYLLPVIFQFSTMPLLARLVHGGEKARFRTVLERTVGFTFVFSIPMALGGAILAAPILGLIFGGAYLPGTFPFQILVITMLVDFPATIVSGAIFAYDHQKSLIKTSLLAGVMNVGLDLILIPRFGMAGSAFGTLATQIAVNWYLWHIMKKINYFSVMPQLKKVVVAGVVMAGTTTLLAALGANVAVNIAASALIYVALLAAFREPLLAEIKHTLMPARIISAD